MSVAFIILATFATVIGIGLAVGLVTHRCIEGHWPGWSDRRRPRPHVLLAIDLMASPHGWSEGHRYRFHNSGLRLSDDLYGDVKQMTVEGQEVALREGEKRALTKAWRLRKIERQEEMSEQALRLWASSVQRYADNVVRIGTPSILRDRLEKEGRG